MDLKRLMEEYRAQADYNIKSASIMFDIHLLEKEKAAEIARIDSLISAKYSKMRTKCGEEPVCNHHLLVKFNESKHGEIYVCLGCGMVVGYEVIADEVIEVKRVVRPEDIDGILKILKLKLSSIYESNPEISLYDAATILTDFVNPETKLKNNR